MMFTMPKRHGGRAAEVLLRLILVIAFAGFVIGTATRNRASATFIQDPTNMNATLDVTGLPGFTQDGLLKLGETDRMSGTFPEDMEAYDLGPYYLGGNGVVDEELIAHAERDMSGETDATAE